MVQNDDGNVHGIPCLFFEVRGAIDRDFNNVVLGFKNPEDHVAFAFGCNIDKAGIFQLLDNIAVITVIRDDRHHNFTHCKVGIGNTLLFQSGKLGTMSCLFLCMLFAV